MIWVLRIREKVKKDISRFPKADQERIAEVCEGLGENPYVGDIVKLEGGENLWRRRTGNYRIKYQIRVGEKLVFVYGIERRTSSTY